MFKDRTDWVIGPVLIGPKLLKFLVFKYKIPKTSRKNVFIRNYVDFCFSTTTYYAINTVYKWPQYDPIQLCRNWYYFTTYIDRTDGMIYGGEGPDQYESIGLDRTDSIGTLYIHNNIIQVGNYLILVPLLPYMEFKSVCPPVEQDRSKCVVGIHSNHHHAS